MRDAEQLAKKFHETYERLAPSFGYETRKESSVPWSAVPEKNRRLMIAVCGEMLGEFLSTSPVVKQLVKTVEGYKKKHDTIPGGPALKYSQRAGAAPGCACWWCQEARRALAAYYEEGNDDET